MKSSAKKVELASVDDLFSTEESRADAGREKVVEIPLSELHSFKGHPFKVKDDDAMMETADSIRQYGVLVPAIARPDPSGGYELVAGHRRHRASELAEKETMPVIVRDLDDDAATIIMVDSNLQRESLLPSERAFAYKMNRVLRKEWTAMMSFEQVIDIFGDYLALDTEMEVCKSRYGYIRVEFHGTGELPGYCSGMVCRTPKELFDLLLSDYESYLEIQRTKGRRNVTEEDKNEIAALCQSRLERWEKGNAR